VRIVVGYIALLAAALLIAVLVTRQVLLSRLAREIDTALAQEVEELRLLADGTDPETGEPFGVDVEAIFDTFLRRSVPADHEAFYTLVDGELFLASFEAPAAPVSDPDLVARWASVTRPTYGTTDTSIGDLRYLAVPLEDGSGVAGVFAVAYFPAEDRSEVLQVIRIVAVAGAVVLVATAVLAWTLAGRVLRPVRELTDTARTISDTDLGRRIPVSGDDELAELGRTFNEMVERLEQGFGNQRQFLDDVAHELRTPITIARGHLEVLGDDPEERAETVAVITDELDRMNRYVDDLLVLAKAEEPDFLLREPVDVGELLTELAQRATGLGDRRWVVDSVPHPGVLAIVADPGRLTQAVLNLAQNAVQHTVDGDEIGLGADTGLGAGHRTVRLWVRDTGPGIDAASMDQLFRRRFRGAASRSQRAEGMGIGLSIVDAIARAHGGVAEARNEPGGGARFTITLPVEPVEPVDAEEDRP
jgi:signal transduction histidine kinase